MTELLIAESVPGWVSVLAVAGFIAVVAGIISIQLWSQRRRARGEEATSSNAEGAEAMLHFPGIH